MYGVGFRNTQYIFMGNGILQQVKKRDSPKFKHRMPDVFACMLGIPEIIYLRGQMRMNQGRIKCCLLTNLTVECALLINFC